MDICFLGPHEYSFLNKINRLNHETLIKLNLRLQRKQNMQTLLNYFTTERGKSGLRLTVQIRATKSQPTQRIKY